MVFRITSLFIRVAARCLCAAASRAGAAALLLFAIPFPAQAQDSGLNAVVGALRAITTMTADFEQTDRQGASVSGKLTLKNPGKIRFEYQKSVPMLIVADGKSLSIIDYDVKQVQRWPIGSSPLGALLNPNRDITRYGKVIDAGNPGVIAIEIRDPKHPEYGRLTLIFVRKSTAPGGWQLTHWVALDAQNNRTTIRLANHVYGGAVSDGVFAFKDPRVTTRRPGK